MRDWPDPRQPGQAFHPWAPREGAGTRQGGEASAQGPVSVKQEFTSGRVSSGAYLLGALACSRPHVPWCPCAPRTLAGSQARSLRSAHSPEEGRRHSWVPQTGRAQGQTEQVVGPGEGSRLEGSPVLTLRSSGPATMAGGGGGGGCRPCGPHTDHPGVQGRTGAAGQGGLDLRWGAGAQLGAGAGRPGAGGRDRVTSRRAADQRLPWPGLHLRRGTGTPASVPVAVK